MTDIAELKALNRLEDVVEESGVPLERKDGERYIYGKNDNSLKIDLKKQRYFHGAEKGDVINWLKLRLGWDLPKVLQYLAYRPRMPRPERPTLDTSANGGSVSAPARQVNNSEAIISALKDSRFREAMRLGVDYPGGIERLLNKSCYSTELYAGWIPRLFIPVVGDPGEIWEDTCDDCFKDLSGARVVGEVFIAIQQDDPTKTNMAGIEISGAYCHSCVAMYQRWSTALRLMRQYLREQVSDEDDEVVVAPLTVDEVEDD